MDQIINRQAFRALVMSLKPAEAEDPTDDEIETIALVFEQMVVGQLTQAVLIAADEDYAP